MAQKPKPDSICFRFDLPEVELPSKRIALSIVARIYDLLGLLAPITIRCKVLLQEMWTQKITWDEPLTDNLLSHWNNIRNDLNFINKIELSRYILTSPTSTSEFHGFADASQRALVAPYIVGYILMDPTIHHFSFQSRRSRHFKLYLYLDLNYVTAYYQLEHGTKSNLQLTNTTQR